MRAREKEVVKRRLAALDRQQCRGATLLVEACLRRFNGIAGQPRTLRRLDALLDEQSYRLAHWRVASEEINYRRFFDVNQLAALRMEDPAVFDEVHRFVFELVRRGAATGLRIDHVDGLFAPGDYLHRLQARAAAPADRRAFLHRRRKNPRRRRGAVRRMAGARDDRLRVRGGRQQPVRRSAQRARAGRHLQAVRPRAPRTAVVRRRWRIAARSRSCTKPCRATSTRSATS